MNEPPVSPDGPLEHPEVHFEPTDVSFRAIALVILCAAGFGPVLFFAVGVFFTGYRDRGARIKVAPFQRA